VTLQGARSSVPLGWSQGWPGQKPQEGHGGAPQCTPTASWASEELVNRQGDAAHPRPPRRVGDRAGRQRHSISRRRPIATGAWTGRVIAITSAGGGAVESAVYVRQAGGVEGSRLLPSLLSAPLPLCAMVGGLRELILKRDRFRCRVCGVGRRLVVHHRDERNAKSLC
jgi:hypothetical protein